MTQNPMGRKVVHRLVPIISIPIRKPRQHKALRATFLCVVDVGMRVRGLWITLRCKEN